MGSEISSYMNVRLFKVFQEILVHSFRHARSWVVSILCLIWLSVPTIVIWICLVLRLIIVSNRGIEVSLFPICCLWSRTISSHILGVSSIRIWRNRNCHSWYAAYLRFADIVASVGKASVTSTSNAVGLAESLIIVIIVCSCHPKYTSCILLLLLLLAILPNRCARLDLLRWAGTASRPHIV